MSLLRFLTNGIFFFHYMFECLELSVSILFSSSGCMLVLWRHCQ